MKKIFKSSLKKFQNENLFPTPKIIKKSKKKNNYNNNKIDYKIHINNNKKTDSKMDKTDHKIDKIDLRKLKGEGKDFFHENADSDLDTSSGDEVRTFASMILVIVVVVFIIVITITHTHTQIHTQIHTDTHTQTQTNTHTLIFLS